MDDLNQVNNDIEKISVSDSLICPPEDIGKYIIDNNSGLKIFHVNIRSINKNFNDLLVLLHRIKLSLDVIVLTECWLSKSPYTPSLPGFENFRTDYKNQNDGVVVYIKSGIQYKIEVPTFVDASCIIIKIAPNIAILALYRSPSHENINPFLNCLDNTLNSLNSFRTSLIIGDLNINIMPQNTERNTDEYLTLVASHGMLPAHRFPTRLSACLDHVILRTPYYATTLVLDSLITDHAPTFICCHINNIHPKTSKRFSKRSDIPAILNDLHNTDFSSLMLSSDSNTITDSLVDTISTIIEKHSHNVIIPSRKRIIKPWITSGLLKCIRHKDKLYRKFKLNPNNENDKVIYYRYRNFCNNLLKKIKRNYEENEFLKAKKNPKATWKLIKQIANINKKKSDSSALLKIEDNQSSSVDSINSFFANVGKNLALEIQTQAHLNTNPLLATSPPTFDAHPHLNSMVLFNTESKEVENIILNLKDNCAVGSDGISTVIIKAARHILIPVLCYTFNIALSSGVFPRAFKKAVVHPVYKGGDPVSVNNYRPISVLTVMSKIFEKLLNARLTTYLNDNNILSERQFGFRSGKSTQDAVLELTDTVVRNMDKKRKSLGIFLDLSKAFDTVSIPILLNKLERIGIRGVALDIFTDYLTDRRQYVLINGIKSKEETVLFGVPQGSVLGPTLFLIYINDLCALSLPNCKIITYADDTALLVNGRSWQEVCARSEDTLRVVMKWLRANLLTLNVSKTKFIPFAFNKISELPHSFTVHAHVCSLDATPDTCNCMTIERVSTLKYLGVVIDSAMNWESQIDYSTSRARKLIFVFKTLRSVVDINCLKTVYFALAQSIFSYCITSWGCAVKTQLIRLERAQRAILKVLYRKPVLFPTSDLYSLSKVPSIRQLFILHSTLLKHSQLYYNPESVNSRRRSDKVCPIECRRTTLASRHFSFLSSSLYNRINLELNIYPLSLFKCKLKCLEWLISLSYDDTEALLQFSE